MIIWLNARLRVTLFDRRFQTQHKLSLLADYVIPYSNAFVRRIFLTGHNHKKTKFVCMFRRWLEMFIYGEIKRSSTSNTKIFASVQGSRLPKEISHHWGSGMWTVHRNRTLSRRYIRNVYCSHKQNIFQMVHQKCVLYTETEHFDQGTSEIHICNVHRNRAL